MTIDIDKSNMIVLPAAHPIFKSKGEIMEIANTNNNIKNIVKAIIIASIVIMGYLIIIKMKDDEQKEN